MTSANHPRSTSHTHRFQKGVTGIFAALLFSAASSHGQVLTSGSFSINSGAGGSGAQSTSCMISSNGVSWSGGAVGVQGAQSMTNTGAYAVASDSLFKFNIGSYVDQLNAAYGIGDWTVSNIQLTLQYTLYANNSRFGAGAGTFDIDYESNNTWVQGTTNPPFVSTDSGLSSWASSYSVLAAETYNWTTPSYNGTLADLHTSKWNTDKTGVQQATTSYSLGDDSTFINAITSASASSGSDYALSLDLIPTSGTMGMCIFTGGGSYLPTLTFDVVSAGAVPEPSTWACVVAGAAGLVVLRRRRL